MVATNPYTNDAKVIPKYQWFLESLWLEYSDISGYILAFIHRSIVNERSDKAPEHNERLEFLWDAILELIITENLFHDYPDKPEWDLTDIRSSIVRGRNLAKVARKLGMNEYLFLGKGEELSWGRENDYLLANCVEAFIGALYLDSGYDQTKKFILEHVYETLDDIEKDQPIKDFKTLLQELSQAEYDITPNYQVLEDSGPDHDKTYITWVYLQEKCIGKGTGSSKKKSQESAAKDAFLQLNPN